jgi:hypothetical protein
MDLRTRSKQLKDAIDLAKRLDVLTDELLWQYFCCSVLCITPESFDRKHLGKIGKKKLKRFARWRVRNYPLSFTFDMARFMKTVTFATRHRMGPQRLAKILTSTTNTTNFPIDNK